MKGVLFFSGGTALRMLAKEFASRSFPTTHLITTFDSGGSSRALRDSFNMPAPGDLRNRLLALASPAPHIKPVISFLDQRLDHDPAKAARQLEAWKTCKRLPDLPNSVERFIRADLEEFFRQLPPKFDPVIASMGNMAITGAFLRQGRDMDAAVGRYAHLLEIVGQITPICKESCQLTAIMRNGGRMTGQHLFKAPPAPITDILLTDEQGKSLMPSLTPAAADAIDKAAIICYPMGSFFSSLLATLLVPGVGRRIAKSSAVKIFIPNTGHDPEPGEMPIEAQAAMLITILRKDAPDAPVGAFLHMVLVDPVNGHYNGDLVASERELSRQEIHMAYGRLVADANHHDPVRLANWFRAFMYERYPF